MNLVWCWLFRKIISQKMMKAMMPLMSVTVSHFSLPQTERRLMQIRLWSSICHVLCFGRVRSWAIPSRLQFRSLILFR